MGLALLGGEAKPFRGARVVLPYASTVIIKQPE
jgi:hypothetical protein